MKGVRAADVPERMQSYLEDWAKAVVGELKTETES
jgi:hypothetical protein